VNKKTIVLKPVNSFLFNRQTPSSPSLTTEDTGTSSGKKSASMSKLRMMTMPLALPNHPA